MGKVVIIGAGHVGSHCAYALAIQAIAGQIILIDIDEKKAEQQAQDIADASCYFSQNIQIRSGSYDDCKSADIVVIAAGAPRKPIQRPDGSFIPMPRLELMAESIRTMQDIIPKLKASGFAGIIIGITNPADVVINYIDKHMGYPSNRVFGTGTGLDTARLKRYLAEAAGRPVCQVGCIAMGEHGDSQIAPISQMTVDNRPISETDTIDCGQVAKLARTTGGRVIAGKGSTEFGIGTVLADLVRAILNDEQRQIPVSALLTGQYGVKGVHAGVPAVIGRGGIEKVIELDLTAEELEAFQSSCTVIQSYAEKADLIDWPLNGPK